MQVCLSTVVRFATERPAIHKAVSYPSGQRTHESGRAPSVFFVASLSVHHGIPLDGCTSSDEHLFPHTPWAEEGVPQHFGACGQTFDSYFVLLLSSGGPHCEPWCWSSLTIQTIVARCRNIAATAPLSGKQEFVLGWSFAGSVYLTRGVVFLT